MSIELLDEDDDAELKEQKKKHEDFLLAEYSSIAQAYFNTTSTIATFFRNYLVIVGLPIPILGFVLTQISKGQGSTISIPPELNLLVPLTACLIALLGLCLMVYVVNLRLDALLYARTVNGIRQYFYDKSPLDYPKELQMRVLPRSTTQPRYYEPRYFLPVIIVFALLNTLYPVTGLAWYVAHEYQGPILDSWRTILIGPTIFFAFHVYAYRYLARHRETAYLRKYVIGVDIDGVLNKHRDTFCTKLYDVLKKTIWADQVTAIPVRDCPGLGVTQVDEEAVFNRPDYWQELAPMDGVAEVIGKLRNVFGFKLFVFTHRPWPEPKQMPPGTEADYRALWKEALWWRPGTVGKNAEYRGRWTRLRFWLALVVPTLRALLRPLGSGSIHALTIKWLHKHGIGYDKLVVEQGNVHTVGPQQKERNRFAIAEREEIRIFVEDDLFKAAKLANICEVVFLIDQPYNQAADLPRNVVRVRDWKAIYEYIRQKL